MMPALTLHRILKAPRARVWDCLVSPAHIARWFPQDPEAQVTVDIDPRPGGRFRTSTTTGAVTTLTDGAVLHLVPGAELVLSDLFGPDWQPVPDPRTGCTLQILLRDHPDGTHWSAITRHSALAPAGQSGALPEGWQGIARHFGAYIEKSLTRKTLAAPS